MKTFFSICCLIAFWGGTAQPVWEYESADFVFTWNLKDDHSRLTHDDGMIWQGSLIPAFWVQYQGENHFIKPEVSIENSNISLDRLELHLDMKPYGTGKLIVDRVGNSIQFKRFYIKWNLPIPKIKEMYIGVSGLNTQQQAVSIYPNQPFAADWAAFAYCIPGAKEGPAQSYFRSWDFGQADIALGSFGPSMGTPYGAAYPRPTYMASMGSSNGWLTFGAGSVPDAPMTLNVRNTRGRIQFLYREDLWGAGPAEREWNDLITITFSQTAWQSMRNYIETITVDKEVNPSHHLSVWNTWGNWKTGSFAIQPITEFARKTGSEILVLDDPWESFHGSATYSKERFPTFFDEIQNIHEMGMQHGVWETLAWVDNPDALGLTNDDLMLDRYGVPCKGSWNFDPFSGSHFILDISSENARNYLIERTKKVMSEINPRLIKLDFGYGIPNPNIGVPRNPAIRGERYSLELLKIIYETAKSLNPDVTLMYYSISPFFLSYIDLVSLDDQGDLWYDIRRGHDQWSIWASLISTQKTAINGSSSYDWKTDDEVMLNTVIIGSPGSVLPNKMNENKIPDEYINRRFALNKWYRRTIQWQPVWFNSNITGLDGPMQINCWGRSEIFEDDSVLTALILRGNEKVAQLKGFKWEGRWAMISQDDKDLKQSESLAIIPFDEATTLSFPMKHRPHKVELHTYHGQSIYVNWVWSDGIFTISMEDTRLHEVAGFLLTLDP